jgi:hypothetical protein
MLREKEKFQLVCRFKRSRSGHLMLYVWKFPASMKLTASIVEGVAKLLKPARIFSELDVFGVEEAIHEPEDTFVECEVQDLIPNHVFDADAFYERI